MTSPAKKGRKTPRFKSNYIGFTHDGSNARARQDHPESADPPGFFRRAAKVVKCEAEHRRGRA